jgi:RNase H-like domain found in reverse transcriptase
VEYLRLIVENGQVQMDPVKTNAITDWPTPTTKKELQSFLGFMNFYRRFIKDFAKVAAPLNKLTGKTDWIWEEDQQWAFNTLKKIVTSDPILVLPNETSKFMLECDASDYATGAILSQQQEDGTYKPVAFLSHAMTPAERNYNIHDKELLAIVRCFTAWRPFLLGCGQQTDTYSDHQNLMYFRQPQDLTQRQARWITYLQDFNFRILHRKGSLNKKADLLSRRVDHDDESQDNKNTIALPDHLFAVLYIAPENREEILRKYHDDPIAGHPGQDNMFKTIS